MSSNSLTKRIFKFDNQSKRRNLASFSINLIIIIISIFYLININSGHDWGGDFSMYILNAKNIVQGLPYAQTPYIYNENVSDYGPSAYPPIFPLLLSPIIAVFGVNFLFLKIPGILCFIGFLLFFNKKIIPEGFSPFLRIILIMIIGFFPYFFILSESILSEFPFLFFCFLSLMMINKLSNCSKKNRKTKLISLATGLLIYISYGIRSIGIILIPIMFLLFIFRNKKISLEVVTSFAFTILLVFIQSLLIPQTNKYFDQIPFSIFELSSSLLQSTTYYLILIINLFDLDSIFLQGLSFLISIEGFVLGLLVHGKKKLSSFDLFFFFYIAALLVWPSYQYLRFLVPIIPLYFLYIIEGFDFFIKKINIRTVRIIIPVILVGFVSFNYIQTYMEIFPRPISAIEKPETQELFQFIKAETKEEDVILFFKPRVLALFTDRKSLAMRFPDPDGDAISKMKSFGVDYVILNKNHMFEYQPELKLFIYSNPQYFDLIFENLDFNIYKVIY